MNALPFLTAVGAIIGALYAISARQLMRGMLGLALFFICIAGFFAQMGAWYLAAGQLFLFVGGVVTLFVLAFSFTKTPVQHGSIHAAAALSLAVLVALSIFLPDIPRPASMTLQAFGIAFFTQYGWVLNIALLLLFSAILSAQYLLEER